MTEPYTLLFEPILKQKVWGGRRLSRLGKSLPVDSSVMIGESWELADLAMTSPTGGGGDPAHSIIANGPLAGRPVAAATALWKARLLGDTIYERFCQSQHTDTPAFPLLLKYLDASEHLSVQIHPSPHYAATHPDAHLKTESWYILDAEPMNNTAPVIYKGFKPGIDESAVREHIAEGTLVDILLSEPAIPGVCHTLPSGTVHALGAGVLVAEVQTPSDTTFRLYDWTHEYGRPERALHIDEALACIDFDNPHTPMPISAPSGSTKSRMATTDDYTIDEIRPDEEPATLPDGACALIMTIAGQGHITAPGHPDTPIAVGDTALVPAALAGSTTLRSEGHLRVLVIALA